MRCTREQGVKIAYVLVEYRSTKPVRRAVCGLNSRQGGRRGEDTKKADFAEALEC